MVAAVVDVLDGVGRHSPLERLDVTFGLSDSKHHVQIGPTTKETRERECPCRIDTARQNRC